MTDEQIKELAEKHGWFGVESWWSMAIPRFRAMLEEYAAQQSVQPTGGTCPTPQSDTLADEFPALWDSRTPPTIG